MEERKESKLKKKDGAHIHTYKSQDHTYGRTYMCLHISHLFCTYTPPSLVSLPLSGVT